VAETETRAAFPVPRLGSPRALELRRRAHELIPGGSHTYAKGDDQWPELTPTALVRGEGCRVWDADGNEFIEYGSGSRAVTLGHAYPEVVEAAQRQMLDGSNYTRPAAIELDCAEQLLDLIGPAEMVKFTKDGSTATSAAVKLARAYTGRDLVALCADHPFFSYDDWFIGTTPIDAGIPDAVRELSLTFPYNDIEAARELFEAHPGQIACVILEAEKTEPPRDRFLQRLQELCAQHGVLFILDEMITGFRYHLGGAQELFGLSPDLSAFGKALANGFALSALVGKREIMELGGIRHSGERVFLLSTTHGAENHALAAAIATMRVYSERPVIEALHESGERLRAGIERIAHELGVADEFRLGGRASNLVYATRDAEGKQSQEFRTLFMQEMVDRGFLTPNFVVCLAHGEHEIDLTIEAVGEALSVYAAALADGVERHLRGPAVKPVYRPFN
jgi:glutamate-1-semialdehyde 2,1-aminomutase